MKPGYVVITPVRDEVDHVRHTLASLSGQTCLPLRWVIVDDGSTDGTSQLLDDFAARHDWVCVVHRPDRGHRANGGGVVEAFYAGYERLSDLYWDFLVKLDADLSFAPDYFERCLARFDAEPQLGIGGGTVYGERDNETVVNSVGDPPFHVRGATKVYRRACWQQISPLIRAPGWDTLDEVRANLQGWRTQTFADLAVMQHKPTGGADGTWSNSFKNGRANYMTGYHPVFMLAKCMKRLRLQTRGLESIGLMAGYLSCYLKRTPVLADGDAVRYLRNQQLRRMLLRPSIYG